MSILRDSKRFLEIFTLFAMTTDRWRIDMAEPLVFYLNRFFMHLLAVVRPRYRVPEVLAVLWHGHEEWKRYVQGRAWERRPAVLCYVM